MKTKLLVIIIATLSLVIFFLPQQVIAQYYPPDSCLYLIPTDSSWNNPDSVKIDTCRDSPTLGQWYATKFQLQFKRWVYIFKTKPFIMDSLYTWDDIDSNHLEFKNYFREVELVFGKYHFQRHPIWIDDASFIEIPTVQLIFDNYIHGETLINFFSPFPSDDIEYVKINQKPVFLSFIEPNRLNKDYIITISQDDKLNIKRKIFEGKDINVFIYDLMGNLIAKHIEKNENDMIQIDISNFQNGLYFVMIDNKYVYKLMHFD